MATHPFHPSSRTRDGHTGTSIAVALLLSLSLILAPSLALAYGGSGYGWYDDYGYDYDYYSGYDSYGYDYYDYDYGYGGYDDGSDFDSSDEIAEAPAEEPVDVQIVVSPTTTSSTREYPLTLARQTVSPSSPLYRLLTSYELPESDEALLQTDRIAVSAQGTESQRVSQTMDTLLGLHRASLATSVNGSSPLYGVGEVWLTENGFERDGTTGLFSASIVTDGDHIQILTPEKKAVDVRGRIIGALDTLPEGDGVTFSFEPDAAAAKGVQEAIDAIEAPYDLGFVYVDLSSGDTVSYQPQRPLYAASTFKAAYCAWLLSQKVDSGQVSRGAVEDLVHNVIVDSDNDSYRQLHYTYGTDEFAQWLSQVGIERYANTLFPTYSATDLARAWALDSEYLLSGEGSSPWLRSLHLHSAESTIDEAIDDSDVLTKAGWIQAGGYQSLNDAGVVYDFNGSPALLVMLTSATPEDHPLLVNLVNALRAV